LDADLHVHTKASDGVLTPTELVSLAVSRNLRAIAITDHDSIDGVEEAQAAARGKGILVVPGVEINTDYGKEEVHILGYFINTGSEELNGTLAELRKARTVRAEKIVDQLGRLGLPVCMDRVLEIAGAGSVGRPHIAAALVEKGYALSVRDAFVRYLSRGAPGYVPRYKITPAEAVQIVTGAGGVPVLAHPGLLDQNKRLPAHKGLFPELMAAGIKGIEVYYPKHTPEMVRQYEAVCDRCQLISTGGSDYHGPGQKEEGELGDAGVGFAVVIKLQEASFRFA